METLAKAFAQIEREFAALRRSWLSARRTLLIAALLDSFADRVFCDLHKRGDTALGGIEDSLAYRRKLREAAPALGVVFDLCAMAPDSPRLVTHAVPVPIAQYRDLAVEDFMVSLYNHNSVERVLFAWPDGREMLAIDVLEEAIGWWREHWPE
jgi:hypothetical protein